MRIACFVMAAVFTLFTYWQFNDLGQYGTQFWEGWVAFYAAAAVISLVSALKPLPRPVLVGFAALAGCAAIWRSLSIEWDKTVLYNETNPAGNESGGLLIVALWIAILAFKRYGTSQR